MQRKCLNVEQIRADQHREQDQLTPLRRVPEEQLDVLENEFPFRDRQPAEHGADRPAPQRTANESLSALLRLRESGGIEYAMQQRPEAAKDGRRPPQQHERQQIDLMPQVSHDRLRGPLPRQEGRRRSAEQDHEVEQVSESLGPRQLLRPYKPE